MKTYRKKVGILGGMGPEATASLYLKSIQACQKQRGAKYNSDFPHIIINSYPVPDGKMWKGFDKKKVVAGLRKNARVLENAGAELIVIPCNSVHYFIDEIRKAVRIPVLSIPEETTKTIKKKKLETVSVLGTQFTVNKKVHEKILKKNGIRVINPNKTQQKKIDEIIVRVEGGKRLQSDKKTIKKMIVELKKKGSEGIILGCTELPLLINKKDSSLPVFDTIDILAESVLKEIY